MKVAYTHFGTPEMERAHQRGARRTIPNVPERMAAGRAAYALSIAIRRNSNGVQGHRIYRRDDNVLGASNEFAVKRRRSDGYDGILGPVCREFIREQEQRPALNCEVAIRKLKLQPETGGDRPHILADPKERSTCARPLTVLVDCQIACSTCFSSRDRLSRPRLGPARGSHRRLRRKMLQITVVAQLGR